jgi:ATP-dependent Clp protease ATP-binding subunit ClpC
MDNEASRFDDVLDTFDDWSHLPAGKDIGRRLVAVDHLVDDVRRALDDNVSFVLVGAPGVGKTAIARLAFDSGRHLVLHASFSMLMADTLYAGWWPSKLNKIQRKFHERRPRDGNVALYIDDFASMFRESRGDKGRLVADDLLQPASTGRPLICGEITHDQLGVVASHARWMRCLRMIEVPDLHGQDLLAALRIWTHAIAMAHDVGVPDAWRRGEEGTTSVERTIIEAILLSNRFFASPGQPGAALQLLGEAVSRGRLDLRSIQEVAASRTGVPLRLISDEVALSVEELAAELGEQIIGQPEAVLAAVDALLSVKAGVTDDRRPWWVALFVGQSGVGKTELAKALARVVFGDASALARFDMSEYVGPQAAATFSLAVVDKLETRPLSVVLFDEIEKADLNSLDVMLQIMSDGRCTAPDGRQCSLRQSIVVLTTNAGFSAGAYRPGAIGFVSGSTNRQLIDEDAVRVALGERFRPEFLGRLDRVLVFRPLDSSAIIEIVRREVGLALERPGLSSRKLKVSVAPAVLQELAAGGADSRYGARPVVTAIRQRLLVPLARLIAADPGMADEQVLVDLDSAGMFRFHRSPLTRHNEAQLEVVA